MNRTKIVCKNCNTKYEISVNQNDNFYELNLIKRSEKLMFKTSNFTALNNYLASIESFCWKCKSEEGEIC